MDIAVEDDDGRGVDASISLDHRLVYITHGWESVHLDAENARILGEWLISASALIEDVELSAKVKAAIAFENSE